MRGRTSSKLCRMIGKDEFGTDNPVEQIALLKADFTESEYVAVIAAANRVNTGEVTAAHKEEAKAALVPFANSNRRVPERHAHR